jgi:uncharacterized protein
MEPGAVYGLRIPMTPTGWVLKRGHRLRLAISCGDFPNLWPTPEAAAIKLFGEWSGSRSRLKLALAPVRAAAKDPFLPPPALAVVSRASRDIPEQQITLDQIQSTVTAKAASGNTTLLPDGTRFEFRSRYACTASAISPAEATVHGVHSFRRSHHGDEIGTKADCVLRSSATALHLSLNLEVTRNGQLFFHQQWTHSEPRRLL